MKEIREITARPLATRRTRGTLAVAFLLTAAVATVLPFISDEPWVAAAAIPLFAVLAGLWWALRRATRLVTEAPDEVLDELLIRLRNDCFRQAYQLLAAVTFLLVGAVLWLPHLPLLAERVSPGLAFPVIALVSGLPMVVAAFRLPDLDARD